jgi:hypothetical protein
MIAKGTIRQTRIAACTSRSRTNAFNRGVARAYT